MSEKRVDPTDGHPYTYIEILNHYKGEYTKKEIQSYWQYSCVAVVAKWAPKKVGKEKANAKPNCKEMEAKPKPKAKSKASKWTPKEVEAGKFAWCSLDPVAQQLCVYPAKQSLLLEAAKRAGHRDTVIMVQPSSMDHGLIASVTFNDLGTGMHVQRTMSGAGERHVRRVEQPCVHFGEGQEFKVPVQSFVGFGRMAWVSVEPSAGVLQPYSRENACIIEERYHIREKQARVTVVLPSGTSLNVCISFDFKNGKHTQSTGSGFRSVMRLSRDIVPAAGIMIPLYRRPQDGTIDSLRYRLEGTEGDNNTPLERVGELPVPESVFMEEASLGVDAFSSVRAMEVALQEMGFATHELNAVAELMKEEPMRLAANVCLAEYKKDNEVTLLVLIEKILLEWQDKEILKAPHQRHSSSAMSSIEQESLGFATTVAALFTSFDEDSDTLRLFLASRRGGGKVMSLTKVAAASLWRTIMQGA